MDNKIDHKDNANFGTTIVFVILALILIIFVLYRQSYIENQQEDAKDQQEQVDRIEKTIEDLTRELTPYERKEKMLSTQVIEDFANSSFNNEPTAIFRNEFSISGRIKNGFVYAKASVDGQSFSRFDDLYVKISGYIDGKYTELGGHLIESKSLKTPQSSEYTELLFDLKDVKYKESYTDPNYEVSSGDWLQLLNGGRGQIILSFMSTERDGLIENLTFFYECETDSCSIN